MSALFDRFPKLAGSLPYVSLGVETTPVVRAKALGRVLGVDGLFIKRDDLTAQPYGGNKVRKLEFLLGDALRRGHRSVLTYGCVGSNHATATAIYAKQFGLRSISILLPQPNARSVRKNLLLSARFGAEFHVYSSFRSQQACVPVLMSRRESKTGQKPYEIPPGGSAPLGIVGYVNAALELADQVRSGEVPEPDLVYVAAGTTGTVVGLMLGFQVAGLKTQVVPICVTGQRFVNAPRMAALFRETCSLIRSYDRSFPALSLEPDDIAIRHDCLGEQYALYTEESVEACRVIRETEGLSLEGTYTGKALAGMLKDARTGKLKGRTALFWNTYNSRDVSSLIADMDYRTLPKALHRYFEEDVQPLDR